MMTYLADAQERVGADLSSLRVVAYGGAPFAAATLKRLMKTFACDFRQTYGQTETSVVITSLEPDQHRLALTDATKRHRLESAGRALPLTEVRVVDDNGHELPCDGTSVGEVVARGPSVMRGYWRDPDRTATKLRHGWCWTGDLATRDHDGYLYIVDRRNDMIITGGENVFPNAVETVLYQHPDVIEAVVVGVPDAEWGEIVTAVMVAQRHDTALEQELSQLCARSLARYMRPRRFHFVDALPKNASGKLLRSEVRRSLRVDRGDGRRQVGVH
jgi:acyl-CoA synthetase (AMP-forming)/AMP-acid ligase II